MMAIPPLVLVAVAVGIVACAAAWVRFCRAQARLDAPVEARAAGLAAATEARAQIRQMHDLHTHRLDVARTRWNAEPDTAELGLIDPAARASASGWWLP